MPVEYQGHKQVDSLHNLKDGENNALTDIFFQFTQTKQIVTCVFH